MLRFMKPLFAQQDGWLRIYPDLPGTGRTPGLDRLVTHDQMLDTMLAFIDTVIPGQHFVLAPYVRPTLIITARQDHLCGYRDAWDLLDNSPGATFAVLDRTGHFVNIEQDVLCQALMREWLDRV